MSYDIQQSTTSYELLFLLVLSSDHISAATGKTPTVTIRKAGGSFGSPAGSVSEIANGWYKVAGNATDTGTLGPLLLHVTEASSDPVDREYNVIAYNPQDTVRLGLTALPNVASGSTGAIPVIDANGNVQANVARQAGTVLAAPIPRYIGTALSGANGNIGLAANTTALQCAVGDLMLLTGGTGAGQSAFVNAVSGAGGSTPVASILGTWPTANPDNTTTYEIIKTGGLVPFVPATVGGRIDANAGSIAGSVPTLTSGKIDTNVATVIGTAPTLTGSKMDTNIYSVDGVVIGQNGSGTQNIGGP